MKGRKGGAGYISRNIITADFSSSNLKDWAGRGRHKNREKRERFLLESFPSRSNSFANVSK